MSRSWFDLKSELNITSAEYNGRGRVADYYEKRVKPTWTGSMNIYQRFFADRNRSPLYKATIGHKQNWGKITLSFDDREGKPIARALRRFFSDGVPADDNSDFLDASAPDGAVAPAEREALLFAKVNGVHVMMIWERRGDRFVLSQVIGKQGPFDGINSRTSPFMEIVNAMIDSKTLDAARAGVPDDATHILVQAELAKSVTGTSHKDVCAMVFAYEKAPESERKSIAERLSLFVFNVSVYVPAAGTRSEEVELLPFKTMRRFFAYVKTVRYTFKVCPYVHFEHADSPDFEQIVADIYQKYSPRANGEGFIVVYYNGEVSKAKAKIVYRDNKGCAFELAKNLLPVLVPIGGGNPVGVICAPPSEGGACAEVHSTDWECLRCTERESGVVCIGSLKWKAGDQILHLCATSRRADSGRSTEEGDFACFQVEGVAFKVKRSHLTNHDVAFYDLGGGSAKCALMYKGNQVFRQPNGTFELDTFVLLGVYIPQEEGGSSYREAIKLLRGHDEDLQWEDKVAFNAPIFKGVSDVSPAELPQFIESRLTRLDRDGNANLVDVCLRFKEVGRFERAQFSSRRSLPSSPAPSPKKTRTTPTKSNLTAVNEAARDFGISSATELGELFQTVTADIPSRNVFAKEYQKMGDALTYRSDSLTTAQKASVTRMYKAMRDEWLDLHRNGKLFPEQEQAQSQMQTPQTVVVVDPDETQDITFEDCAAAQQQEFEQDRRSLMASAAERRRMQASAAERRRMQASSPVEVVSRTPSPILTALPQPAQPPPQPPQQQPVPPPQQQQDEPEENWEIGNGCGWVTGRAREDDDDDNMELHI